MQDLASGLLGVQNRAISVARPLRIALLQDVLTLVIAPHLPPCTIDASLTDEAIIAGINAVREQSLQVRYREDVVADRLRLATCLRNGMGALNSALQGRRQDKNNVPPLFAAIFDDIQGLATVPESLKTLVRAQLQEQAAALGIVIG